jgi:hypothetical protein
MKFLYAVLCAVACAGCSILPASITHRPPADIHLAQCKGPATSLPDSLARLLPPRTGHMIPDDGWADLALTVPGGFAGVVYDPATQRPILMLTDTTRASAAKVALAGTTLPLQQATVRQVRWNFAQLVDWFNYIIPRVGEPISVADKDEAINRIHLYASSAEARDRLVAALEKLPLPCDLVVVDRRTFKVSF